MARSALGSTSGGAGSPNGLTEGVSCVEWCNVGRCTIQPGTSENPRLRADSIRPYSSSGKTGSIQSNRTPSASRSLSSSPKGGAEGASRRVCSIQPGACENPGLWADAIRPYRASFFIFVWSAAYRSRRWRYIRRKSRTPHTCRIKFPVRSRTDSSSIGLFCDTFAYPPIKKAAGEVLQQLLCYSILCGSDEN